MGVGKSALAALRKLGIVVAVAATFLFGLVGTVYLSLRTSEVQVPDVVGKDLLAAETALNEVGLNIRKRATRPSLDKQPNTVLDQVPRAGEVIKSGQTIAVDVSRAPKEGESVPSPTPEARPDKQPDEGGQAEQQNPNANAAPTPQNQNANQNQQNQNKRNRNANNSNNRNTNNTNNRNANNRNANNANANRNNANNRNAANVNAANRNAAANRNQNSNAANANRPRTVVPTATPANTTNGNARRTP